ncbi:hypothetical protein JYG34_05570 [Pseudomonas entomophila]|nr:hypothetical protein JYG34_05570 [Pseudomonas entomophila]
MERPRVSAQYLFPASSVDQLVERRLPAWLTAAQLEDLQGYQQALKAQQACAEQMRHLLERIPTLEAFAVPRLEKALLDQGEGEIEPRQAFVELSEEFPLPSAAERLYRPTVTYRSRHSLLAAALHNFHAQETQPWLKRQAHLVGPKGARLGLSFERFAALCRDLNIGAGYQALLKGILKPKAGRGQPEDAARKAIERLFQDTVRTRLHACVYESRFRGRLDAWDLQRLLSLFAQQPWQVPGAGTLTPRQLNLLGKPMIGVVTLEWRPSPEAEVDEVIAWLPGDPEHELRHYDSWDHLYQDLSRRLRESTFRQFFRRFVKASDRAPFDSTLMQLLAASPTTTAVELDGRHLPVKGSLFEHAGTQQIARLFDDARYLAVPTGDEDRQDRQARLQALLGAGLDLLSLAALFMPLVGELLLVGTAAQLLDEVYEGYKDWRLGDRQGALDHLFAVAQSVVLAGVGAGAVQLLRRAPFVDLLEPLTDAKGRLKLFRQHERAHLEQGMTTLAQHALAQEGQHLLSSDVDILLKSTGFRVDQLRRLCVEHAAPSARLLDVCERMRLHAQQPRLRGKAFDQALAQARPAPTADQALLIRNFDGLSPRAAEEIITHCSTVQLERLRKTGRVPLAMAERARWYLRDSRLDLACLGIRLPSALNVDSEQLMMRLIEREAPWSAERAVQLRVGRREGLLLFKSQGEALEPALVIVRGEQGYTLQGADEAVTVGADGAFSEVLLRCLDADQRQALGRADLSARQLREALAELAWADREQAAELIGLAPVGAGVRPPRRFADGRLGFALSGGGESSQQAIRRGIHQIFPTLSELQLDAYLEAVRARGQNLWEHYQALQRNLADLRQALAGWQSQWRTPIDAIRRRRVVETLRRGWRRKLVDVNDEYELVIDGEHVGELPALPEDVTFPHVQRLVLRDMVLQDIDAAFLGRFPNLVELDLSHNRLTQVPEGIEALVHLRRLNLSNNQLVIDARANSVFAQLALLDSIELSFNPLMQAPDLSGLRHVRHVHLRATQLTSVAELLERTPWRALVDARDNRIAQLEQDLHGLRQRVSRMDLHDNPLDTASSRRLDQWRGGAAPGEWGSASYRHREAGQTARERWTETRDATLRAQRQATWDRLREEPGSADLFRFLGDFRHTEDFDSHPGHYRRRIWRILDACEQNEVLREQLFREAGGPRSCEDRLLLLLNQLEVGVLVQQGLAGLSAERLEQGLLRLGRQLHRLDLVDEIAARHVARMRASGSGQVDEIEVRLFYRNQLAKALELPIQVEDMHFAGYANVTEAEVIQAQVDVLQSETPQTLQATLVHRPFWRNYLRRHHAARFEALAEPFHDRLAAFEAQAESGAEQPYVQQANDLMHELELAERQLEVTLTEEAWSRYEP